jgi:hypothetical protein
VVIPLLGHLKGETGMDYHMLLMAATTRTGFKLALWIRRVIDCEASKGFTSGPLFRDEDGDEVKASTFEPAFLSARKNSRQRML